MEIEPSAPAPCSCTGALVSSSDVEVAAFCVSRVSSAVDGPSLLVTVLLIQYSGWSSYRTSMYLPPTQVRTYLQSRLEGAQEEYKAKVAERKNFSTPYDVVEHGLPQKCSLWIDKETKLKCGQRQQIAETEANRIRKAEVLDRLSERMCLPRDVVPSLGRVGKATSGSNSTLWAVDQRPFVWVALAGKPTNDKEAPGDPLKTRKEGLHPAIPLPDTGRSAKLGGEDESSLTLACTSRSVETPPSAKEGEELQSKVWVQAPDVREAAAVTRGALFCSLPRVGEGHMDLPQQSASRDAFASSCKSSPRTMTLPIVRENSLLAGVPSPRDVWDGPGSEGAEGRSVPWGAEDRLKQSRGALKRRLRGGNSDAGETLRKAHHKATVSNRYMCDSASDDEDQSDEDEEGRPAMAEKRLKRMLSNRASAQRSRLRRQERLDTLEVMVAELRVANAVLTKKGNTADAKAKKFEDENKELLERVGRLEGVPLSDSTSFGSLGPSTSNRGFDESMENRKQPHQRWNNPIFGGSFDFDFGSDPPDDTSKPPNITPTQDKMQCQVPDNSVEMNVSNLYQSEVMGLTQPSSFQGVDPFGIVLEHFNQEMDRVNSQPRFGEGVWSESLAGESGQPLGVAACRRSLFGTRDWRGSDCQCTRCSTEYPQKTADR